MSVTIDLRTLVAFATGLAVALIAVFVFQAWRVDAAPGDSDTTFVPITPCRLIDTRPAPLRVGPSGTFSADDTRTIAARGTNGNCTIPNDAVGLSLNVTAVGASQATFLTVWPDGTKPTASSLNPTPGEPPTPNAVTTQLSGAGAFNMFNRFGTVDVIVDVGGYYSKTSLQALASRLAAAEATIATNTDNINGLDAAQPFTLASDFSSVVQAQSTETEIRRVEITAPVDGHVALIASGYMFEGTASQVVRCGLMESVAAPPSGVQLLWRAGTSSTYSHLSASRVFDLAANTTQTYFLVCRNLSGGTSSIYSPQVTAIFTPAP